jgi:molybdopterin-guanine dinucleotide biosynthesis protein A
VYHRNTRPAVEVALDQRRLRMRELVAELGAIGIPAEGRLVRNVNTEEDWHLHLIEKGRLSERHN